MKIVSTNQVKQMSDLALNIVMQVNASVRTVDELKRCFDASGHINFALLVTLAVKLAGQIELFGNALKGPEKLKTLQTILVAAVDELNTQKVFGSSSEVSATLDFIEQTLPFAVQGAVLVGRGLAPALEKAVSQAKCCF